MVYCSRTNCASVRKPKTVVVVTSPCEPCGPYPGLGCGPFCDPCEYVGIPRVNPQSLPYGSGVAPNAGLYQTPCQSAQHGVLPTHY